ncbi:MAG: cytochrome b [Maritimibacter sp.]|nr:cytochrome b [Maritimibacter sp.]
MPAIANTPERFGLLTRALHWLMALGIVGMLAFGTVLTRIEPSLSTIWMYGVHKSVGLVLLALALGRIAWHRASPPPPPLGGVPAWQSRLARATHRALYLLVVAVPLSGWIGSAASGLDVVAFGRWTLPRIAPISEPWQDGAFLIHGVLTKLLAALIVLHIAGALKRRDGTLRRMVRGRAWPSENARTFRRGRSQNP